MKSVLLFSHRKGGVGKSTLSLNTAAALNARGIKTVVLDLDRASGTAGAARDTANVVASQVEGWTSTMPQVHRFFADSEVAASRSVMERDNLLRKNIRMLRETYQVVIIDAGAGEQEENALAIQVADVLLVPFPCDSGDFTATLEYVSMIHRWTTERGSSLVVRAVVNKFQAGRRATAMVEEQVVEAGWPAPALDARIPSATRIPEQTMDGKTAFDLKEGDDVRLAFKNLGKEVAALLET